MPRKAIRITRTCPICSREFLAKPSEVNRGGAIFCSRKCRDDNLSEPLEVRFHRNIGPTTDKGCILWVGTLSGAGYGVIFDRRQSGKQRRYQAHRLAWTLEKGPIPEGLDTLHRCDNPPCVNIAHLFLGTNQDNIDDKVAKGRQTKGEDCYLTKLTEDTVRRIRALHATGNFTLKEISEECGTTYTNVWMIVNRRSWKHI
jgi:hypothetical protein